MAAQSKLSIVGKSIHLHKKSKEDEIKKNILNGVQILTSGRHFDVLMVQMIASDSGWSN